MAVQIVMMSMKQIKILRFIGKLLTSTISVGGNFKEKLAGKLAEIYLELLGVELGKGVKPIGIPLVEKCGQSRIRIGNYVTLRSTSRSNAIGVNHRIVLRTTQPGAEILIGEHVGISGGAICAKKSIRIGAYSVLGSNVVLADNDFHPIRPEGRRYNRNDRDIPALEIDIRDNVWIGADSYILKGVTIGENSVIGAMSVVTKSIPPNCVAAGNPAKVIRHLR